MNGPHVAVFTIPAPVHVNPTLAIVATLVRRGCRVTYVTSERWWRRSASWERSRFYLVVAKRLHIPSIRMSPQLILDEPTWSYPAIPEAARLFLINLKREAGELFHQLRIECAADIYSRDVASIYFYVRDLQLNREVDEKHRLYAARSAAERPNVERWNHGGNNSKLTVLSCPMRI